ncbi:MAG: transglycosylase SLT domain-containing protein [Hydrogenophaga sp.]|nr:transglycosylase SLT domain-containing protein [Hydrogenophaga sp.]
MRSASDFRLSLTRWRHPLQSLALFGIAVFLTACATAPAPQPAPVVTAVPPVEPPLVPARPRVNVPTGPLSEITVGSAEAPPVIMLAAPQDIWDRIRRGLSMPDMDSDLVRDREQWYVNRPDYLQRMTERSSRYLFHIVEEIERRNLPMELALLPFIESAFNPQAVSNARAAGMWQFMPATGESFDLKQNAFRDDRRDVLASTRAALDYLEQLYAKFGDWHLALAAYNWGQGNVARAITRNQAQGLATGYADLSMPLETRMYVPKLQAVENIIAHPETFGANLPLIGNHPFFDTITIERDMDVALIANLAGITEKDFRTLNPSIKQPLVMAAGTPNILLPWDNAKVFEDRLKVYQGNLASWTAWVAPSTMSAAQAAAKVGMSEAALRALNNIPPRMKIRAGSSLLVPRIGSRDRDVSEFVADNGRLNLAPDVVLRRKVVRARKGDNLARLASRYGVSAVSAANWNGLSVNARLKTGQRITLMVPQRVRMASSSASSGRSAKSRKVATRKGTAGKKGSKSTKSSKRPVIKLATAGEKPPRKKGSN